jgi:hypothetical protein
MDKRLTNLKPFKPGQSGNPKGKKPTPQDLKDARKLNTVSVARILNKFSNMPVSEIKAELERADCPTLEFMIGKVMVECLKAGDYQRLNFILDRMIGKVTEKMEVKTPRPTVIKLIGDEAEAIVLGTEQKGEDDEA